MTTKELEEQFGRAETIKIILDLVEKGIPPIEGFILKEGKYICKINYNEANTSFAR